MLSRVPSSLRKISSLRRLQLLRTFKRLLFRRKTRVNVLTQRAILTLVHCGHTVQQKKIGRCLLYTSDAADDLTRVDLGGRGRHGEPSAAAARRRRRSADSPAARGSARQRRRHVGRRRAGLLRPAHRHRGAALLLLPPTPRATRPHQIRHLVCDLFDLRVRVCQLVACTSARPTTSRPSSFHLN